MKVGTSDGIFNDLQVEDAVKREGWENRVFHSVKLELVLRGMLTTPQPLENDRGMQNPGVLSRGKGG